MASVKKPKEKHRSVVGQLEAELQEKLSQLQLLSAENEMLKLRAAVLEATVQSREDQMLVISEHGPPVYPVDSPTPAASAATAATSNTSGDTGSPSAAAAAAAAAAGSRPGLPADLQSSGSTAAGEAGAAAAAAAAAVLGEGVSGEAAATPAADEVDGSGSPAVQLDAQPEMHQEQQRQQHHVATLADFRDNVCGARAAVKAMSVEDIIRHWKQFLQDVTGELVNVQREESSAAFKQQQQAAAAAARPHGTCAAAVAANGDAAGAAGDGVSAEAAAAAAGGADPGLSPSHARINEMVAKYSFLVKTAQQLNPSAYCRLFGTNLDTGLPAPYSDAHWRRVVSVLGLTKHQVNHILACAELYFSCRAKLQSEQRVLQQHLKATAASTESMLSGDDAAIQPWLDRLASNLKREHVLRVMLNSFVWCTIFTPVQCAKAAVYSHPWYVDVHAIVCVMCEDALTQPASGQRALVFPHRLQTSPLQQMQQMVM
ncbi:hypothetical protein OEZ85_000458 [Tetradesmus obliquus]|uniref:BZIP domain-containing protein n=1 Tax=Tetradesmus obliquus TaxID=3088 RepID=A0ABY8UJJ1_TETOB|nr:hypothetical protein OEZ85_000458 [Tetradesmus obliquus]